MQGVHCSSLEETAEHRPAHQRVYRNKDDDDEMDDCVTLTPLSCVASLRRRRLNVSVRVALLAVAKDVARRVSV